MVSGQLSVADSRIHHFAFHHFANHFSAQATSGFFAISDLGFRIWAAGALRSLYTLALRAISVLNALGGFTASMRAGDSLHP
jgi:hypothetical protein